MYKIVRFYFKNNKRTTVESGVTLEYAQAHCSSPESSWDTCTTKTNRARTRKHGQWFDGYQKM